jgi:hypothetical protein
VDECKPLPDGSVQERFQWGKRRAEVGHAAYCLPRHPPHSDPPFLSSMVICKTRRALSARPSGEDDKEVEVEVEIYRHPLLG